MSSRISRRAFAATVGLAASASCPVALSLSAGAIQEPSNSGETVPEVKPKPEGPREAPFDRDYPEPTFRPSWKKEQINRQMAQDFVIYAHSELEMVKQLLDREPGLINAAIDWGGGDYETALGGASHMGRKDIVRLLLSRGARMDLFCSAMMGQLEAVRAMLTLEPSLIDAKGPHGFSLHFHAQCGEEDSLEVLEYLQSIKPIELKPVPFLKKKS